MTTSKNKCNTLFGRIGKSADENAFEWVEFVRMIGQSNTDNQNPNTITSHINF